MSVFLSLRLSNAIRSLSGDQRGLPTATALKAVNSAGLRPSRSHTQIASLPKRSELKAIFLPSGENCGSISQAVDAITRVGTLVFSSALGPGIRQTLESNRSRSY